MEAESQEQLNMAMNEFPERFLLDVTQPHLDYEEKDRVEGDIYTITMKLHC